MSILGVACVYVGDAEETLSEEGSLAGSGGIICSGGAWQYFLERELWLTQV